MDRSDSQALTDWIHAQVSDGDTTAQLREKADESNLPVDAKKAIMDLPDQEWTTQELTDEVSGLSPDEGPATGGFFPSSGSPV
jgi:hypothetical protein